MFFAVETGKSLRPVYMRFMVDELAVIQYKLLPFFITVEEWPVVT